MRLFDTDVLIDHFHGHQAALEFIATSLSQGETLAVSVVTLTELLGGMRPGEEERTERLLRLFTILPVDETVGRQAAVYLSQFRRDQRIELGDALIAATAHQHGAELFTRNLRHYPMTDITVTEPYQRGK